MISKIIYDIQDYLRFLRLLTILRLFYNTQDRSRYLRFFYDYLLC